MTRYSLSLVMLAIIVSLSSLKTPLIGDWSQSQIYQIMLGMLVFCFVIGKVWPDLFNKNKKDSDSNHNYKKTDTSDNSSTDTEYYVKHKNWTIFSIIVVLILILLYEVKNG